LDHLQGNMRHNCTTNLRPNHHLRAALKVAKSDCMHFFLVSHVAQALAFRKNRSFTQGIGQFFEFHNEKEISSLRKSAKIQALVLQKCTQCQIEQLNFQLKAFFTFLYIHVREWAKKIRGSPAILLLYWVKTESQTFQNCAETNPPNPERFESDLDSDDWFWIRIRINSIFRMEHAVAVNQA